MGTFFAHLNTVFLTVFVITGGMMFYLWSGMRHRRIYLWMGWVMVFFTYASVIFFLIPYSMGAYLPDKLLAPLNVVGYSLFSFFFLFLIEGFELRGGYKRAALAAPISMVAVGVVYLLLVLIGAEAAFALFINRAVAALAVLGLSGILVSRFAAERRNLSRQQKITLAGGILFVITFAIFAGLHAALLPPGGLPLPPIPFFLFAVVEGVALIYELGRLSRENEAKAGEIAKRLSETNRWLARELSHPLTRVSSVVVAADEEIRNQNPLLSVRLGLGEAVADVNILRSQVAELEERNAGLCPDGGWVHPPVDLAEFLEKKAELWRQRFDQRGQPLETDLPERRPLVLRLDPLVLNRIADNLLANAVRYAERAKATVSARRVGGRVLFSVSDEGPGFPPEKARELAERDSASMRGAGFRVVSRLAASAGGEATFSEGEGGRGLRVTLSFPDRGMDDGEELAREYFMTDPPTLVGILDDDPKPGEDRKRILLLEDSDEHREQTAAFLRGEHDVSAFASAEAALESLGFGEGAPAVPRPDMVITDLQLAGAMDGLRFLETYFAALGEALPTLITSQYRGRWTDRLDCAAIGVPRFLDKPISHLSLEREIRLLSMPPGLSPADFLKLAEKEKQGES